MAGPGIGIIGSGWGARVQVPTFRAAGWNVVALAGSHARKTQRIAAEQDIPYATGDWQALLSREDVDLVSIVTPPGLHCQMAVAALEAGKHVLCEKPTAMNVTEARRMVEVAQAHPDQLALIDHELRFLPSIQTARQFVSEGCIGQLRHAEAHFINSSRANLNRVWNWWSDIAQGGGILGAIGSHQIDTIRYILADDILAAQGLLKTFVTERPVSPPESSATDGTRVVTSDDFASYQLQFAHGGVAIVTASMIARTNEQQSITLYGDEGTLRFTDSSLFYACPDDEFHPIAPPHDLTIPENIRALYSDYAEATVYMAHAIRAAVEGDRSATASAATFLDGLRVQQVLDAIRTSSAQAQGWVEIAERHDTV